jgi:hypothetical protein
VRCIFLGYPFGKKGWKLFDLEKEELFISRDVIFHENIFPFHSSLSEAHDPTIIPLPPPDPAHIPKAQARC